MSYWYALHDRDHDNELSSCYCQQTRAAPLHHAGRANRPCSGPRSKMEVKVDTKLELPRTILLNAAVPVYNNMRNRGGLAKCNPIAYWTLEDTFDYIAKYKVPHHPLHAKGYPSIG